MIIPNDLLDFDEHHVTSSLTIGQVDHNDYDGEHFNKAWFRLKEIPLC